MAVSRPVYQQVSEKLIATPANAGVQIIKTRKINNILDSGVRRNDGFGCFSDFFRNLLENRWLSPLAP